MIEFILTKLKKPQFTPGARTFLQSIHIDGFLFILLLSLSLVGLLILYSATNQNVKIIEVQIFHLLVAFAVMIVFAQIPPASLKRAGPWMYTLGLFLLVFVLIKGHIGKGGQRWINLGLMRFQPSELMKLAVPIILAWYYHQKPLPISLRSLVIAIPMILFPAFLTAKQPDLGTAILFTTSGISVLFLAGLDFRIIWSIVPLAALMMPLGWLWLYDYQKQRILTFLNPEWDPLGKGYHIIQSKIAIGSGGLFGKGIFNGTQSNLQFLPEHSTDFIFAVCSEEFGFIGNLFLISLYLLILARGFYITICAQDTFSRLLAGSITFTFFVSFFINMGMVTGILPVVGVPLQLVSYGGSSMVTMLASFGMLMSIQTHRKLVST